VSSTALWSVALEAGAELAERPVWDERAGALLWVDISAGCLHRFRPGGTDDVIVQIEGTLGAAALRSNGGYVLAADQRFLLIDEDGSIVGEERPDGIPDDVRFNDGACDPSGRFWAGTVADDHRSGGGCLYRLDPGGHVQMVLAGVTESNGVGWSPTGDIMYYVDSEEVPARVRAFDFDASAGALGRDRDVIVFGPGEGVPDGLVVDSEGFLWIAVWEGSQVIRVSPKGEVASRLPLPVSQPTCPGFGGEGLQDLYVTTAWQGLNPGQRAAEPMAGHIFVTKPDAPGLPAVRFAG
jgi:sugar lactone lactonase YvrE